jgi:hypothetical protein
LPPVHSRDWRGKNNFTPTDEGICTTQTPSAAATAIARPRGTLPPGRSTAADLSSCRRHPPPSSPSYLAPTSLPPPQRRGRRPADGVAHPRRLRKRPPMLQLLDPWRAGEVRRASDLVRPPTWRSRQPSRSRVQPLPLPCFGCDRGPTAAAAFTKLDGGGASMAGRGPLRFPLGSAPTSAAPPPWNRMHSRREGMQFWLTSLLEGNLPPQFALSVGAHASREQCVSGRQKCICSFCWS